MVSGTLDHHGNIPDPIGSMYAIYGNIYHQYIPYMDPGGWDLLFLTPNPSMARLFQRKKNWAVEGFFVKAATMSEGAR